MSSSTKNAAGQTEKTIRAAIHFGKTCGITAFIFILDETLSRNQIMEIRQHLNRLGFDAGRADGVPGPRTRAAIRAFQQKHNQAADGYPSAKLLERLRAQ